MTEASVWLDNHESETYSLYISLMCWNKHKIIMNTGCLLDMARHFEAEGVCGKQLQFEILFCILFFCLPTDDCARLALQCGGWVL